MSPTDSTALAMLAVRSTEVAKRHRRGSGRPWTVRQEGEQGIHLLHDTQVRWPNAGCAVEVLAIRALA
jgi:hypothetical protein